MLGSLPALGCLHLLYSLLLSHQLRVLGLRRTQLETAGVVERQPSAKQSAWVPVPGGPMSR